MAVPIHRQKSYFFSKENKNKNCVYNKELSIVEAGLPM